MKEELSYICETCGQRSLKKQTIKDCELKGNAHQFPVGTAVKFQTDAGDNVSEWFMGVVKEVKFTESTHVPRYMIGIDAETAQKLHKKHGGIAPNVVEFGHLDEDQLQLQETA